MDYIWDVTKMDGMFTRKNAGDSIYGITGIELTKWMHFHTNGNSHHCTGPLCSRDIGNLEMIKSLRQRRRRLSLSLFLHKHHWRWILNVMRVRTRPTVHAQKEREKKGDPCWHFQHTYTPSTTFTFIFSITLTRSLLLMLSRHGTNTTLKFESTIYTDRQLDSCM